MRILVTGGAGFIGSHVVDLLVRYGHDVVVVDNLSHGDRANVSARARFIHGDVLDPGAWLGQVRTADAVVHLAAQISVPISEKNPPEDVRANVLGTVEMLQAARWLKVREFRLASSAAVYGDNPHMPLKENDAGIPLSYYGLNKWAAELYVGHESRLGRMTGTVLRMANVYGPRQRTQGEGGVVAIFCEALAGGKTPTIDGDGGQTRDFIAVGDVARAFLHRLGEKHAGGTFNIGTGRATSVMDLWMTLANLAGVPSGLTRHGPPRPGDIRESVLDVSSASRWGFRAAVPLAEGLSETYRWFLDVNR